MAMNFSVMNNLIIIIGLNHHLNLTTTLDSFRRKVKTLARASFHVKTKSGLYCYKRVQFPSGKYDDEVKIVKFIV